MRKLTTFSLVFSGDGNSNSSPFHISPEKEKKHCPSFATTKAGKSYLRHQLRFVLLHSCWNKAPDDDSNQKTTDRASGN
jgi:hypothetical protein